VALQPCKKPLFIIVSQQIKLDSHKSFRVRPGHRSSATDLSHRQIEGKANCVAWLIGMTAAHGHSTLADIGCSCLLLFFSKPNQHGNHKLVTQISLSLRLHDPSGCFQSLLDDDGSERLSQNEIDSRCKELAGVFHFIGAAKDDRKPVGASLSNHPHKFQSATYVEIEKNAVDLAALDVGSGSGGGRSIIHRSIHRLEASGDAPIGGDIATDNQKFELQGVRRGERSHRRLISQQRHFPAKSTHFILWWCPVPDL